MGKYTTDSPQHVLLKKFNLMKEYLKLEQVR